MTTPQLQHRAPQIAVMMLIQQHRPAKTRLAPMRFLRVSQRLKRGNKDRPSRHVMMTCDVAVDTVGTTL